MHDWEQSTVEAEHVISALTVENQIVLDPFMGSGTTRLAALKLKRKFHRNRNRGAIFSNSKK